MRSITYVSSARELWSQEDLDELLVSARAWNEPRELTGVLLYSGGNFIQTVEGPDDMLDEVFDRIRADQRHHGLLVMLDEPVESRSFPDWTMGFRRVSPDDLDMEGYTDFLRHPATAGPAGASAQVQLLHTFRLVTR